ncbi:MAG: 3-phosphoglycerate dehydrogenase family protein [Lachnospiraceae bacterium]|jgi:D-3-phosphoglycerate dehydrogenase
MYTYKCLNPIADIGLKRFSADYEKVAEDAAADVILVRSAELHDMEFGSELKAIARAGAGVNNIPLERCAKEGIVVFNTPGANANAVKELFIFAAIAGLRDIVGGINWTASLADNPDIAALTEKEKKRFTGHELTGKTLGVIGLGAIGAKVANVSVDLGMRVVGYDAFLNDAMKAALNPQVTIVESNEEVIAAADIVTIHVPALPSTKGMLGEKLLKRAKDGLVVINLARDTLIDADAMRSALESGKVAKYICDFPTKETQDLPNTVFIPHLGASTEESEDNCAIMAVVQLQDFLENGNIKNSVNYPAVDLGRIKDGRITVCHLAEVDITALADVIKGAGLVITAMAGRVRGDFAYSMFDVDKFDVDKEQSGVKGALEAVTGVLKVRLL